MTACPKCIAEVSLRRLRAFNAGEDVPALGVKLNGRKLDYATQAGFAEVWLEQVVSAPGPTCPRHDGPLSLEGESPALRAATRA